MAKIQKKEALLKGWELTKKNFWFLAGILVFTWAISLLPEIFKRADNDPIEFLAGIAVWVLLVIIEIGVIKIFLKMIDGREFSFKDLFNYTNLFFNYLFTYILYSLIILGGLILLIVPGIIWAIKYCFSTYLAIDKKMKPLDAIKKSGEMTQGIKWELFLFWLIMLGLNILGALLLMVGLIVTVPVTGLAFIYIYRKLEPAK
jgi:uncharacterized membrane protein